MKRLITILFFMTACFALQAACPETDRKDTLEITPEVFGCVGDGITDDTEGLQKAFDYCKTHNRLLRSQKGKIYAVSKTIMVNTQSDIQVDFGGAIIMAVKPMEHIIDLMLAGISKRLEEKQLKLVLTDEAKQFVIDHGYDPAFGARPLKRYLQSHVETLAAEKIIRDDPAPGDTLTVCVENGELVIK